MTVVSLGSRARRNDRRRTTSKRKWIAGESTTNYYLIVIATGLLLLIGLVMILSASSVAAYTQYGSSFLFFKRQALWVALGVTGMVGLSRFDYHRLRPAGWALSVIGLLSLMAVLHPAIGTRVSGSSRWIGAGPIRFQPSELMKLALLIFGADAVARRQGKLHTLKSIMVPVGAVAGVAAALVMMQPDLGTTIVLATIVFSILYVGGTSLPLIGAIGFTGLLGATGLSLTEGYRRARLLSFLHPFSDPMNSGYQAVQSMIALGSGGTFGVGLGQSRQKWLYVPNAHTDFIFSILGEELGLIGTIGIVGLFVLIAFAGVRAAKRAPDPFGRLLATGATVWIVGQAFINMGAVTGLLPITGVPLPLVSFGGSALVFTLIAVGILANVARQEKAASKRSAVAA
ncbi:MAG: putative lipid II flippase FtsW [Actinomycetota bacterium]|nr:putative lipid II flippase FtsW [Actinomycetota bacterium]